MCISNVPLLSGLFRMLERIKLKCRITVCRWCDGCGLLRTLRCVAEFTPLRAKLTSDVERPVTERVIPPSNGFGADDDSLGNCLSLIPKPPKRDFARFMELDRSGLDGHVLRFLARLEQSGSDHSGTAEQRRFIICYFLADATVSVFEQSSRNAGTLPTLLSPLLWPPYGIWHAIIFLPCGFFYLSSSSFFPRLISTVVEWKSTIHGVAIVRI